MYFMDVKGKALDDGNALLKEASSQLRKAVGISCAQEGDLFTCYSPSQYLILLSGADPGGVSEHFSTDRAESALLGKLAQNPLEI